MPAYIIFIRERLRDSAEFKVYSEKAMASAAGHTFKMLSYYVSVNVFEGAPMDGVVIMEFPTVESAKAWYNSPAYVEARQIRYKSSDYRVFVVDGRASSQMPVYVMLSIERIRDPVAYKQYVEKVSGTTVGHTFNLLAARTALECLEGAPMETVVLVEFQTVEAAKAWYNSSAYTEVKELRFQSADSRFAIVG